MSHRSRNLSYAILIAALVGVLDASFLTYKHFFEPLAVCGVGIFGDCGTVLSSPYSVVFGIPLAALGIVQYLAVLYWFMLTEKLGNKLYARFLFIQSAIGLVFSLYFTYLQFFVIGSLCQYCLLSALTSTVLYILIRMQYGDMYQEFVLEKMELVYKLAAKPILFAISPECVHEQAMLWGERLGKIDIFKTLCARVLHYENPVLSLKVGKVVFSNPVGLSAGYDYEAAFPGILPSIGFGFQTIGTISDKPFEGNPKPRLGRLPKSKSLLVNKGFRNPGADAIIKKLKGTSFAFPVGISIGRTNNGKTNTLEKAIADIISAFQKFEKSKIRHAYYELNISCPNLVGNVSFYPPKNLKKLLKAVEALNIKKPLFIKMPIEESDKEVKKILDVIVIFKYVTGVIFGNLQKDRNDTSFYAGEIQAVGKGHFSGKPTYRRSNELIKLAYILHGKRLMIIGCGGVFTAEDAYRKIRYGATFIQLITGMIFEGPQRIAQINRGLVELLKKDGYSKLSDAVGVDAKSSFRGFIH